MESNLMSGTSARGCMTKKNPKKNQQDSAEKPQFENFP